MVQTPVRHGLEAHGIERPAHVHWNLTVPALYEECVRRGEGMIAQQGPLVVRTGQYTGRSPKDKFVVEEPASESDIWWGKINQPLSAEHFDVLHRRALSYLEGQDVFAQDLYAGADPRYRISVRVISEGPYHSLFARNMFIRPPLGSDTREPDFTVISVPGLQAVPEEHGTHSGTFIVLNLARKMVLIGGTSYAGEIKKSVFTVLNYMLPKAGVLSMHCSANRSEDGNVALFFGLSGTGKTTLSTVPDRYLIGDDEHGWSDQGVFNFEGGSYAKTIRISQRAEPEIYSAVHRFGTVLENVVIDPETRQLELDSAELTENTRAAFPIDFLPHVDTSGMAGHPRNIIFLTADAFGVLPPVSRLTPAQARYYFLSGYTAKVAGTERGVTEPQPNFSTCFGAPFLPLHPHVYAGLLGERIQQHGSQVWLVNTGWTGGPYGVGHRINIEHTRAMVSAIINGSLDGVSSHRDAIFGLNIPDAIPGVPSDVLTPADTWEDREAYDRQARKLASMFKENFEQFAERVPAEVREAGPQ